MRLPEPVNVMLTQNPYHQARVEHYLDRVEEFVAMARYAQAQKLLNTVFSFDPDNKTGRELSSRINSALAALRSGAVPLSHAGNGQARHPRRGELVLVADQDERILSSLATTLRKYGFGAIGAGSLEEAFDTLAEFKPNLIISEVNFETGPIGYDLYLWVRHNEELQSTPFLFLATRVTREMLIAGKRLGVDEFILKPLDEEVVMASVLHCLSRKRKKAAWDTPSGFLAFTCMSSYLFSTFSSTFRMPALTINEIFHSIQGESSHAGLPCVFVRLTGCNLRCTWCDTEYAFYEGEKMSIEEIVRTVEAYGCKLVEVTGGEPLAQEGVHELMTMLCDHGYDVLLETSGSISIADVDSRVRRIVDIKCPGSGMVKENLWENIAFLTPRDEVKFVVGNKMDFEWAVEVIQQYQLDKKCPVLMSPVFNDVQPIELAQWILERRINVRFQLQMHKYIWEPETRGV
jgi:7-carboxy-7-deazaguanine synthase